MSRLAGKSGLEAKSGWVLIPRALSPAPNTVFFFIYCIEWKLTPLLKGCKEVWTLALQAQLFYAHLVRLDLIIGDEQVLVALRSEAR